MSNTKPTMLDLLNETEFTQEELAQMAADSGQSIAEIEKALERRRKKLEYRKQYNARDYRKASRKLYNLKRKMAEDLAVDAFKRLKGGN